MVQMGYPAVVGTGIMLFALLSVILFTAACGKFDVPMLRFYSLLLNLSSNNKKNTIEFWSVVFPSERILDESS